MEKDLNTSSFDSLQDGFANWDAGVPSENVWDELEADLVTESVWSKVSKSIDATTPPQMTLKESFENWDVEIENDGWSKLNDSLSRERVWVRLSSTLAIPVSLPTSYLKIAASFLVFMFTSLHVTNNSSISQNFIAENTKEIEVNPKNTSVNQSTVNATVSDKINQTFTGLNQGLELTIANNTIENKNDQAETRDKSVENGTNESPSELNQNKEKLDDLTIDPLFGLALNHSASDIPAYDFKREKDPKWFVSAGSQLALLREVKNGPLTSTAPRLGAIGEIGHTFTKNRFFISQSLGFSQFTSEKGRYINGRFLTANQKLNVGQAKIQFGYSFNRISFNVGLNANRIFSGYESQGETISNVYDVPQIKLGFNGGFEVKLKTFKNKDNLSVVTNYQFIPKLVSKNAEFESIEAVNFQLKYAF